MDKKRSFYKEFKYVFSKKQRWAFSGIVMLNIISAVLETAAVAMMLPFLNSVLSVNEVATSQVRIIIWNLFGCQNNTQLTAAIALCVAILYVVKSVYRLWNTYIQNKFFARCRSGISARLFDCILRKPWSYHLEHSTAETQRAVVNDVGRMFELLNSIMLIFSAIFNAVFLLAVLMYANVQLTIFAIILIVITLVSVNKLIVKAVHKAGHDFVVLNTGMMKWVHQAMGGLKGVIVNLRYQLFVNRYAENATGYAETDARYKTFTTMPRVATEMICMACIFFYVAFSVWRGMDINVLLPTFATFALAAVRFIPVANSINDNINVIRVHNVALDLVYDSLKESGVNMEEDFQVIRRERPVVIAEALEKGIEINHVSFKYNGAQEALFEDVSLTIPANKSVAFIGPTGAGKTTLADIIIGLHNPTSGQVLADGHDVHNEREWWADRVGYIPQSIYLCDDTIRVNVAFGVAPEEIDDDQVWKCLEDAKLKEFIQSLPDGLDTKPGENGLRLSGGQRQRLGIARALYTNPPFLVLDEATSSLDTETEAAVMESIDNLSGKKTMLIIAHRLSTIKNCDIIFRIENGHAEQTTLEQ